MTPGALHFTLLALAGCSVGELDLDGLSCPCVTGFHCDPSTNTCVAGPSSTSDGGLRRDGAPDTGHIVDTGRPDGARTDTGGQPDGRSSGGSDTGTADRVIGTVSCDAANTIQCGSSCVDPSNDTHHCGECNIDCAGGTCMTGACQPITLASSLGLVSAVAVDSTNVYWAVTTSAGASSSLFKAPQGGGATVTIATGVAEVSALAANSGGLFAITGAESLEVFPAGSLPAKSLSTAGALATGLAVDDTRVYWGEGSTGGMELVRSSTASGSATTLTTGTFFTQALAVVGSEVYFADYSTSDVLDVATSGGASTVVGSNLASVSTNGLVFVSGDLYALTGGIYCDGCYTFSKVSLAGGTTTTLAMGTGASYVAIAGDTTGLYAADSHDGLHRVSLTGTSNDLLGGSQAVSVALTSTFVYWADQGVAGGSVLKLAK